MEWRFKSCLAFVRALSFIYLLDANVLADGTLTFSYIALIFLVPRILSPFKQRVAVYIWCTVILLLFSVLLSLFSVKNPGMTCLLLLLHHTLTVILAYPFRLLL